MANLEKRLTNPYSEESSLTLIEKEKCNTNLTKNSVPKTESNEKFESNMISRQRKRIPSAIMKEKMESEKFRKTIHQQEKNRAKRKYTKRLRKKDGKSLMLT